MKNVFAIVVTWNGMQYNWIDKCLTSLKNAGEGVQTIVINNASSDETVSYIKSVFPEVVLIASEKNLGFGAANNLGLEKALDLGGEYFLLLNQDAWVIGDSLEKLVNISRKTPEYGIISPLHLNGGGDELEPFFESVIGSERCKGLYSDFVLDRVEDRVYESGFINAAAWLITKECLKKVGGFSPSFYHYGEDDNFVDRLLHKKLKIGVYPHAKICHDKLNSKTHAASDEDKYRLRMMSLILSAPNQLFNFRHYYLFYCKEVVKRTFKGNFNGAFQAVNDLKYLITERINIEKYRRISIEDHSFAFLKCNPDKL
ncbi:glycosyltransferase family 2 protein [Kaistella palustris]|uniref:glycosyltransferase family 2 protein n=1 Tax=Kaistella palustris TaxID=493376 RepID=UPI00041EEC9A|nr:glycosyltransferase family 2 protein [Kaistella palustris]